MNNLVDEKFYTVNIPGFHNYEVSASGLLRNKNTGRFLQACANGRKYYWWALYNRETKKLKSFRVHRLVYTTIKNIPYSTPLDIHHIDGDKKNNKLDNLLMLSRSEHKRLHEKEKGNYIPTKSIKNMRKLFHINGLSVKEISKKYKKPYSTVYSIIHFKTYKNVGV